MEATIIEEQERGPVYEATIVRDPPPQQPHHRNRTLSFNHLVPPFVLRRFDANENSQVNSEEEESEQQSKRRTSWKVVGAIMIPLLVAAIIVGVVMGIGVGGKSDEGDTGGSDAAISSPDNQEGTSPSSSVVGPTSPVAPCPSAVFTPPTGPCSEITINIVYDDNPHESSWDLYKKKADEYEYMLLKSHKGWHGDQVYTEQICLEEGEYKFTINDAAKDGICCGLEGDGYYNITDADGALLAEGGDFEEYESKLFSISGTSTPPTPTTECASHLDIAIIYDDNPHESSWELIRKDDNKLIQSHEGWHGDKMYTDSICLEEGQYEFTIKDKASDGICCGLEGDGYYKLTSNGKLIAEGGEFEASETTSFSIIGATSSPSEVPTRAPVTPPPTLNPTPPPSPPPTRLRITPAPTTKPPVSVASWYCIEIEVIYDTKPWEISWDLVRTDNGQEIGFTGPGAPGDTKNLKTVCLGEGEYKFTIYDNARDGLCCASGNGSYSITLPTGAVLAEGGEFGGASESTSFTLPPISI